MARNSSAGVVAKKTRLEIGLAGRRDDAATGKAVAEGDHRNDRRKNVEKIGHPISRATLALASLRRNCATAASLNA